VGTFSLPVPGAQAGAGELTVRLWGATSADHLLSVRTVGGEAIGQVAFSGAVPDETTLLLPAGLFGSDTLDIEITAEDSPTGGWSSVLVDGFDVTWQRAYTADAGAIKYTADGATSVSGFASDQIVTMDVSDPFAPVWIAGGDASPAGTGYAWSASLPAGEYASAGRVMKPLAMVLDTKSNLSDSDNRAEYVIITHPELEEAAEALSLYRSKDLRTMVVDIQDVYDEFAGGEPFPSAMNAFAIASQSWKTVPRYFVILGDGSFDYRDIMGTGYNYVSPQMWGNSNGLYASDTLQGDINGDGIPEVAFGRIPIKSVAEGQAYLAKLSGYEAGIGELPSLLLSDIPDKGGDFNYSTIRVGEEVSGNIVSINLQEVDINTARTDLDIELDSGIRMVNYIGHGGVDRLTGIWPLGLLNYNDVAGMNNAVTPSFIGLSCLINNYSIPGWDGLGELLVLQPGAGMVVSWAASGESYNDQATALGIEFHRSQRGYKRLGDAIIATFRDKPYLVPVYTLMGDPALRMQ
jgi:hypothetical protein